MRKRGSRIISWNFCFCFFVLSLLFCCLSALLGLSMSRPVDPRNRRRRYAGIGQPAAKPDPTEDCHTCDTLKELDKVVSAKVGGAAPSPPGLRKIGRAGWTLLHTVAAYYPEEPSAHQQGMAIQFLESLGALFPCHSCAGDFTDYIADHPPVVLSRSEFSLWLCMAHNHVNQKLDKPIFPCDQVDRRWRSSDDE